MKKLVVSVACVLAGVAFAVTPEIRNVTAKQRWPWNGKVDITYEVVGDVTAGVPPDSVPVFRLSATDHATGSNYVARTSAVSGDMGLGAGTHAIVWDMAAEGLSFMSGAVVFSVSCETAPAPYCVIDLSAGANAANYGVAYMVEPPSGGFNTDEYKTTKLVLRLIEPGTFMMGGQYEVTLTKPFYCGIFEVTQKQYELVTGSTPSNFKGDTLPVETVSWDTIRGDSSTYNWPNSTNVDASSFIGKLQARTGLNFDLPTEAQWEYACRAGTTTTYYWGDKMDGSYCWYSDNSSSTTHPVGMKMPNAWGLYDMSGNVREWCLDWYGNLSSGVTDPSGSSSGSDRVLRGGCWIYDADLCASSCRLIYIPSYVNISLGFRLVGTLSD